MNYEEIRKIRNKLIKKYNKEDLILLASSIFYYYQEQGKLIYNYYSREDVDDILDVVYENDLDEAMEKLKNRWDEVCYEDLQDCLMYIKEEMDEKNETD